MTPEIILGPPGTGKTTKLLEIVDEELARGVPPDRMCYVTFTRKGAEVAIERAMKKFSLRREQLPYFRTLHSLCYRALGINSGEVMNKQKLLGFADWVGVKITGRWSEDGTFSGFEIGDRIMFMENLARVRMIPLRQQYDLDDDGLPWNLVDRVARAYASYKQKNGLVDYTDMLYNFLRSGINLRLEVVFDDEAQDQSALQWAVLQKLSGKSRRMAIAGDDDQALYKWAGADVDSFVDLQGKVTVLGHSHRVPQLIQGVASGIISGVQHRRPKEWSPRSHGGTVSYANEFDNVDCSKGNILILTRNIYLLREQIEPALRRSGIIYDYNGHTSVPSGIIDAITHWEKLREGGTITAEQARRVYEYMGSGTGVARGYKKLPQFQDDDHVSLADLQIRGGLLTTDIWHDALDRIPAEEMGYLLAARKRGEKLLAEPRVRISTIHGAKGGEADHVVLLKEIARRTHREMELDEDSERRVWYVGATRARQDLTIVEASTPRECPWL
jgi:DNA helicase-2/ATP-dependent DNA helicase PcrA